MESTRKTMRNNFFLLFRSKSTARSTINGQTVTVKSTVNVDVTRADVVRTRRRRSTREARECVWGRVEARARVAVAPKVSGGM